jgi:alcohol dehydrogenase class IV
MPTQVLNGSEIVSQQVATFAKLGKRAMLITGRHSAKASGAYQDVTAALEKAGITYCVFAEIENNPSVETVVKASQLAKARQVDFVIGIGGGSALDASKAVAILTANELNPLDLFNNDFTKGLPIVAIPTTAGTGSEVTPYAVLSRSDLGTKVSFGNALTYPQLALLDAKYTASLSLHVTVDTAIDAFTHVFESYMSKRAMGYTDQLCLYAIAQFGYCLPYLIKNNVTVEIREKLLEIAMLGGYVIAQTGVTIVHGMGYSYTSAFDYSHGKANGLLLPMYLQYLEQVAPDKLAKALTALGCSAATFIDELTALLGTAPMLSASDIQLFTKQTLIQKGSIANTLGEIDQAKITAFWKNTMY